MSDDGRHGSESEPRGDDRHHWQVPEPERSGGLRDWLRPRPADTRRHVDRMVAGFAVVTLWLGLAVVLKVSGVPGDEIPDALWVVVIAATMATFWLVLGRWRQLASTIRQRMAHLPRRATASGPARVILAVLGVLVVAYVIYAYLDSGA